MGSLFPLVQPNNKFKDNLHIIRVFFSYAEFLNIKMMFTFVLQRSIRDCTQFKILNVSKGERIRFITILFFTSECDSHHAAGYQSSKRGERCVKKKDCFALRRRELRRYIRTMDRRKTNRSVATRRTSVSPDARRSLSRCWH